jgi:hypothetical protein
MEWKLRLNAVISQSGTKWQSFRRNLKDPVLRFAGIVSTLKSTCTTFGVLNGVERAVKRRNISIRNEMTEFSSKFERSRLRFAGIVATLKSTCTTYVVSNGVERAFKWRKISIRNEMTEFSSKFEILRFAVCWDCFDTEIDIQYVRRVEWSGNCV